MAQRVQPGRLAACIMIKAMMRKPMTVRDLCAETGMAEESVRNWVRVFMTKHRKLIYISNWVRVSSRHVVPAYSWGWLNDVERPAGTKVSK